jgi:acetoin utilization deacetylase AcuC-like enzyme
VVKFVYSPDYCCDLGGHVFRTEKYRLLFEKICESALARPGDFLRARPAERRDLELVHTSAYLDDLIEGRHTRRTMASEMPISRPIVDAFILGAGGTMLACRTAAQTGGFAMNLAGGFHHAFPDWAEGFCYINHLAVGLQSVRRDGLIRRAMVVDCDLHQGNGTAYIFRNEPDVFTLSIHEEAIYPVKRRSDLDVGLPSFCDGPLYLRRLQDALPGALDAHRPELVLYLAGADPYLEDQLGTLMLTVKDLEQRDRIVLGACAARRIPAAVVLAGGYAPRVGETVQIHFGTARVMAELADELDEAPQS